MTSNFDARKRSTQEAAREMDSLQRDRFELLSAYIDGEVTAQERYQVQEWLATDPNMQRLHARLLRLRQETQRLPGPSREQSSQELVQEVFHRIDRRRTQRTVIWGGAAIAALFVSALSGVLPGSRSLIPQLAQTPKQEEAAESMIIVSRPLIEIPKAAVVPADDSVEQPSVGQDTYNNRLN